MYVTNVEVGELIGKILEMESLLLGGPSVLTQLAVLDEQRLKVDVYFTLWHQGEERFQLCVDVPMKDEAPQVVHFKNAVAVLLNVEPGKLAVWQASWNDQLMKGFDAIPEGSNKNPIKLVIPASQPLPSFLTA